MEPLVREIAKQLAPLIPVWHINPDVFSVLNEAIVRTKGTDLFRLEAPVTIGKCFKFSEEYGFKCNAYTRIGDDVEIGCGVQIGGHVSIGKNVKIGDGVKIGDYVCICENVTVGNGTNLYRGATVNAGTQIGANVEIGNNVSIGEKCRIDANNKIKDGCCILNLVTIGEGCVIFCNSTLEDCTELKGNNILSANSIVCFKSILDRNVSLSNACIVPTKTFLKPNSLPGRAVVFEWGTHYTNGTYFGAYCDNFEQFQKRRHGKA